MKKKPLIIGIICISLLVFSVPVNSWEYPDCPTISIKKFLAPNAWYVDQDAAITIQGWCSDGTQMLRYQIDYGDGTSDNQVVPNNAPWTFHHTYTSLDDFDVQVAVELANEASCNSGVVQRTITIVDPDAPAPCPEITGITHPNSVQVNHQFRTYVDWIGPEAPTVIRFEFGDGDWTETTVDEGTGYEGDVYVDHTYDYTGTKTITVQAWREDEPSCSSEEKTSNILVWAPAPDIPPNVVECYFEPDPLYIGQYGNLYVTVSDNFDGSSCTVTVDWGHGDFDNPPSPDESSKTASKGETVVFEHTFPYTDTFSIEATASNSYGGGSKSTSVTCQMFPPGGAPVDPEINFVTVEPLPYQQVGVTHTISVSVSNLGEETGSVECCGYQINNEDSLGCQSAEIAPGASNTFVFTYDTYSQNHLQYMFTVQGDMSAGVDDEHTELVTYDPEPPSSPAFAEIININTEGLPYDEAGQMITFHIQTKNSGEQAGDIYCTIEEKNYENFYEESSHYLISDESHTFTFSETFSEEGDLEIYITTKAAISNTIDDEQTIVIEFEAPPPEDPDDEDPDDDDDGVPDEDPDDDDDGVPDEDDGDSDGDGIPDGGQVNSNIDWTKIAIIIAAAGIMIYITDYKMKNNKFPWEKNKKKPNTYNAGDSVVEVSYADGTKEYIDEGNKKPYNDTGDDYPTGHLKDTGDDFPSH